MFQYAAGRSLSTYSQSELFLDLRDFKGYEFQRRYELETVFALTVKEASPELIHQRIGWRDQKYLQKLLKRPQFSKYRGSNLIIEPHFHYWPGFFGASSDAYLYGYWQSEKYFKSIEDIIRSDFQFHPPLDSRNISVQNSMYETQSISLHIRRGDYLTDLKTTKVMAVCSLDYYQRAVDHIRANVWDPVFYIFSDDIEWARKNFDFCTNSIYIDHNQDLDSYKDMQLMSSCKHHIIANSSFSWWGAWLNASLEKIVIAPKQWFANRNNDQDLIPESWIRL